MPVVRLDARALLEAARLPGRPSATAPEKRAFVLIKNVLEYIKDSRLRPLAVTTVRRAKLLPDVPTIAESVVPGFSAAIRYGLVAPAGTPAPIVERLSRELRAAVMSEEVRERMLSEGAQPLASTPAEYAAEIDSEERKWSALVQSLNLKME